MSPDDHPGLVSAADAVTAGFSTAGLAALNQQMHGLVDDQKLAGVVTLVARHGEIVNFDAYGVLDVSAPTPVHKDSIFRIASMTKPITGAAMMLLWEEGKWALDDELAKHIPEFAGLKVRCKDGSLVDQATPMTMRQIMSHSAGFGRAGDYPADVNLRAGDLQDMIDVLAKLPLSFQPGTEWRYGPSVDIQGYLIEKLSGQGLDAFFEQRLFAPLGMADTGFWVDAAKGARVSRIHKYVEGKIAAAGPSNMFNTSKPKFLAGGGGLVSTAHDYWRFAQMIMNGGEFDGRRYLKQATVDLMHVNVLAPGVEVTLYAPDTRGLGFGMDFAIVQDPAAAKTSQGVESYYWGGAFGTWFWIDPINDMTVIGMIQNTSGSTPGTGTPPVREISAKAVYAAMTDRKFG
ncbi:MAG TPA: serine hydrolase domain-containing protein [Caulobacteraceae bacterium]|jgi:CubicO group peptidase (beta-lactamase class C family)|nr:serine hydrolase domain-containing protein [Caulobacteraceae bacterium]